MTGQTLHFDQQHLRLTQVLFQDQTDRHNELVAERTWLLHPSERNLTLSGNLFLIEDMFSPSGWVLIKQAPLPHARPEPAAPDLHVVPLRSGGFEFELLSPENDSSQAWTVLEYYGDRLERARVLQDWQRSLRPETPFHRTPCFLTNTWGDRSQDSRINQAFIEREIKAAARLGADVVQIDDGWERGVTINSAQSEQNGGVWEGFWNTDPDFWQPHSERFPNGLKPLAEKAHTSGLEIGLWFAPDSWADFANWEKDAALLLDLHRRLGVHHFKVDGVKARTALGIENLNHFFSMVLDKSGGQIVLDLDITAEIRPGYFGAMPVGTLFVENRYSDWHNYWPHQTLRNLWMLANWIDPMRLRMEFLNNVRNTGQYAGDPLAPAKYQPDTLFATVMMANPLGWFEVSNLPPNFIERTAALVAVWRQEREAMSRGTFLPIGAAPDGLAWTGFLSVAAGRETGWGLIFREDSRTRQHPFSVPELGRETYRIEPLGGRGICTLKNGTLRARIPRRFDYCFFRFEKE
jgi:alpha-galactosidase